VLITELSFFYLKTTPETTPESISYSHYYLFYQKIPFTHPFIILTNYFL